MEHLAGGGRGQSGVDALELRERLDGAQWDLAAGHLPLQGLWELQDPQVLTDAGLCGFQPFGDALDGSARVDQPLVAASAGTGARALFESCGIRPVSGRSDRAGMCPRKQSIAEERRSSCETKLSA